MGQIGTMGHPEVQQTVDGASTRSAHSDRVTGVLKDLFDVAGHPTGGGNPLPPPPGFSGSAPGSVRYYGPGGPDNTHGGGSGGHTSLHLPAPPRAPRTPKRRPEPRRHAHGLSAVATAYRPEEVRWFWGGGGGLRFGIRTGDRAERHRRRC